MSDPILQVSQVVKRYGELTAVGGVSFEVRAGECYGLLGPNGAGKTTLFKLVTAMARRSDGDLRVFGIDPEQQPSQVKARLGVVNQEDNLDPDLNVIDNLLLYGRYHGMGGAELTERCQRLLAFLELEEKQRMPIVALSGGMKRRLMIVRALLNDPEFLLLDEPTTGLDPQIRHAIWAALRRLKDAGLTILLTTHYMEEAAQLADRVGIVHKGQLIAEGGPRELVREHLPKRVLELAISAQAGDGWRAAAERCLLEEHGDRAYVFGDDEDYLREQEGSLVDAQLRITSLEDLFLKLTGRSLGE
jgi:lipooligosaccharide transport system ATP-binding protein